MQLCSRFKDAFLRVDTALSSQEYMCYSIVQRQVISCLLEQQRAEFGELPPL